MRGNRTLAIVQARMTSTRLPGKVMKNVVGKPMLELMIERLRRSTELDSIVIAVTENKSDQPIVDLVESMEDILLFRGSEDDVLSRYYGAACKYEADAIVRVTSDCPLIDSQVLDDVVKMYSNAGSKAGYVSNVVKRTFPRGLDTEVFSFNALEMVCKEATAQPDREHVTEYILQNPGKFSMLDYVDTIDHSDLRWTVDTEDDLKLVEKIYEALYPENPKFLYSDILDLLEMKPEWNEINRHVEQKVYGQ